MKPRLMRSALWALGAVLMLALFLSLPHAEAAPPKADLFVAPNGNDTWSGTRDAPDRGKKDGPFATIQRARDAVRALKAASPGRKTPVVVMVRGGTYALPGPFVLTPDDSGTADAPIVYAAYPNETPVLSGGTRITGWRETAPGRWEATLPDVASGAWNFTQLFVDGQRRSRPRLPESGYYFIAGDVPPTPEAQGKGFDRFRFAPGTIHADWNNLGDVEVLPFHIWTMSRFRIKSVDAENNIVAFTGRTRGTDYWASLPKGNRFLVENVREALRQPGQWYLDRPTGVLTYLARPGERPDKTVVIAPRQETLVELQGDVAARRWVEHVTFRGLRFAHANWVTPPEGNSYPQAEVNVGAAITAVGARDCAVENCTVTLVGGYGVEWGAGCQRNRLDGCTLSDLGAGGVKIGETSLREDAEAIAGHNVVRNSILAHGGRMHPAAVGVWIGHSPYNTIEHNAIYDFYYTGISPGWSWGYGPSGAHHNTIAYNHIYNLGQGVLSDMGGIYTLGVSPGTVLHHNVIHDVVSFDYGGWGIYFDEGTTGAVARDNVVYRTKSAPFHQHYGKDNVVENNVFAFGREAQLMRTRPEEHRSFTLTHNIVYWTEGPLLGSNWSGDHYALDNNLYWNAGNNPITFAGMSLDDWRAKGQDVHSRIADPLFVAPEKGDFRLKPGSPALALGFEPIDVSTVGPQPPRPSPPDVARAFPPPPPPQPIAEDFENTPVGDKAPGAQTAEEENTGATVRVTDETAAGGKHSLKFTDAAGQKQRYNPHLHYAPKFAGGILEARFALRIEPGAVLYHEWRDSASPYRAGPSLHVAADGTLVANNKTLTQLPLGRWIRFEITCGVGEDATGAYDLVVRLPGRTPPLRFPGIVFSSSFRDLRWFGFVADGNEAGVFYLDDLHLAPRES